MKKIAIYSAGVGVIDTESRTTVRMNGEAPIKVVDLTAKNLEKHFPDTTISVEQIESNMLTAEGDVTI